MLQWYIEKHSILCRINSKYVRILLWSPSSGHTLFFQRLAIFCWARIWQSDPSALEVSNNLVKLFKHLNAFQSTKFSTLQTSKLLILPFILINRHKTYFFWDYFAGVVSEDLKIGAKVEKQQKAGPYATPWQEWGFWTLLGNCQGRPHWFAQVSQTGTFRFSLHSK